MESSQGWTSDLDFSIGYRVGSFQGPRQGSLSILSRFRAGVIHTHVQVGIVQTQQGAKCLDGIQSMFHDVVPRFLRIEY